IWPRNTEYEIFTVGEHQHTLGALFVLNHHSIFSQGAPLWKPIAEQAKAEGALMDMDKLDWPYAMTLPFTTGATLYELANNHMWRTEFGLTQWNSEAPAFMQPPGGGREGDEFDWLAYTLGQYYTLLNAGFPLVPTAGTASGVHPVPAGFSRVYVNIDGPFSYDKWLEGLAAGRSFVTTGPLMFVKVNGEQAGATIATDRTSLSAKIVSEHPLAAIEVVVNGKVVSNKAVEALTPQNKLTPEGAFQSDVVAEIPIETSGWVCLRCTEDRPDKRLRFAHTAPWWLDIPDKPLRPSQQEKDYLMQRVQQEIVRSTGVLPDSALSEYKAALRHFESLPIAEPNRADATNNAESTSAAGEENAVD
ncbi:MAG: CehA/McbA family metallohydrolase, partial [Aureliella sp.]